MSNVTTATVAVEILLLRGHKVLLDADPATLYGVETRVLVQAVQAVKRDLERFPDDFMFQLTWEEAQPLRSQSVILNAAAGQDEEASPLASRSQSVSLKRGANVKYRPYAFTEQGVAMVSSVLRSPQAVAVNIEVMRAVVRLREVLAGNKEMAAKPNELERKLKGHDQSIAGILDAIRLLMAPPPEPKRRPIGFVTPEEKPGKPTVCPVLFAALMQAARLLPRWMMCHGMPGRERRARRGMADISERIETAV